MTFSKTLWIYTWMYICIYVCMNVFVFDKVHIFGNFKILSFLLIYFESTLQLACFISIQLLERNHIPKWKSVKKYINHFESQFQPNHEILVKDEINQTKKSRQRRVYSRLLHQGSRDFPVLWEEQPKPLVFANRHSEKSGSCHCTVTEIEVPSLRN